MNTIIEGLHTCQQKNAPVVGQIKAFIIEDRGNWNKIRNPDKKQNEVGVNYRIVKAEQTDYTDKFKNVSFNLEIEKTDAQPSQNAPQSSEEPRRTAPMDWDERSHRIERQHSQEMAMRYFDLCSHFTGAKLPTTQQMRDMISWFQRDISNLPEKPQAQPHDENDESDEPPFRRCLTSKHGGRDYGSALNPKHNLVAG